MTGSGTGECYHSREHSLHSSEEKFGLMLAIVSRKVKSIGSRLYLNNQHTKQWFQIFKEAGEEQKEALLQDTSVSFLQLLQHPFLQEKVFPFSFRTNLLQKLSLPSNWILKYWKINIKIPIGYLSETSDEIFPMTEFIGTANVELIKFLR